jgi:hypothetical protein
VTDAALVALRDIGLLHALRQATAGGWGRPAGPDDVWRLWLDDTKVTDAGIKELAHLQGLKELKLAGARITDAGMKELANLTGLQLLDLSRTKVTDAGLKELANLQALRRLELANTPVTDAGIEELRKALPECGIRR